MMLGDPVFDIFREEAREHLGALEKSFLDLEAATAVDARRELIDGLFRHAHSLKGDAKVVGLESLKEAAQILEDILDELRSAPQRVDRATINQGLSQYDQVRAAFEAWQGGEEGQPAALPEGLAAAPLSPGPDPTVEPPRDTAPQTTHAEARPSAVAAPAVEEAFSVRVPSERLDRMLSLVGEIRVSHRSGDALRQGLAELGQQLAALPTVMRGLAHHGSSQLPTALATWQAALLDRLQRIESDLHCKRGREELLEEALETDIREARLLPLIMLTDTLRRAVRDLAQSLGKSIRYEADVGKILLDKAVIEALKDPLLHLVRNAADHGVEGPQQRRAAGKSDTALIRIQASRQGELVRIAISDDGRGLDYDAIRARIRHSGQLTEAEVGGLAESALHSHLFRPGFTTAVAGDVSGRGVGLDAARHAVHRLHGSIEVESSSPRGTTIAITVPVTVSTARILTVLAGGQYFGIPSGTVIRTGRAKPDELHELEGHLVLPVDGRPVRWLRLADLVGPSGPTTNGQAWPYVLTTQQGRQTALAVDELEDESEVLLKPLGFPLGGVPGIVGASIRADGAVQLVLDLSGPDLGKADAATTRPANDRKPAGRILVVDDSPTTRAVLRNVFTAAGYVVSTATDGVDALERLKSRPVDLIVSDVEMPRLNGFDLTRQVKSKFGLPVILVTGKEKEDHRREGLEAGADAYVVKSTFQGTGILEIVQQFV